jgi:hypothetical protein
MLPLVSAWAEENAMTGKTRAIVIIAIFLIGMGVQERVNMGSSSILCEKWCIKQSYPVRLLSEILSVECIICNDRARKSDIFTAITL